MIIILNLTEKNLAELVEKTAKSLLKGILIIYPTDTVYGLGVDATNQQAVEKIFELKGRKEGRGIACIFQSIDQIKKFCQVDRNQEKILQKYLPGPYTFLLKPKNTTQLAKHLTDQEKGTVGVRIPDHQFTKALARQIAKPFTTTSANLSGLPSPKIPEEVEEYLLQHMKQTLGVSMKPPPRWNLLFIDAGPLAGIPSTVVDLTKTPPDVIRQGAGRW